jgi:hypothetical protein
MRGAERNAKTRKKWNIMLDNEEVYCVSRKPGLQYRGYLEKMACEA